MAVSCPVTVLFTCFRNITVLQNYLKDDTGTNLSCFSYPEQAMHTIKHVYREQICERYEMYVKQCNRHDAQY